VSEQIPEHFRTLGGLEVVHLATPGRRRAHVALHVRIGSRFETPASNGISHFLEHMMYRGTEGLPTAHDVNAAFERLGGMLYAHTQVDAGLFSVSLPRENLREACRIFGHVVTRPAFSSIDVERNIVREEILEDLDDDGRDVDPDNQLRAFTYGAHPLGYPITGPLANVERFTVDELRDHFARHYTRANVVVALAGDFDRATASQLVDDTFAAMPEGVRIVAQAPPRPREKLPRSKVIADPGSQTALRLSFRALPAGDPARTPLELILRMLDDGMATRLYHRICDELGLCYDTSAHWDAYEDDGVIDFSASATHERLPRIASEILGLLREFAENGPTDDELEVARRRQLWDIDGWQDAPEELVDHVAAERLFRRDFSLADERARAQAVTRDDVVTLARTLFAPDRLVALAVGAPDREAKRAFAAAVAAFGAARP